MRVAYVNADPGVPVFGTKGSSIHLQEVISAFLKRGANVDLFTSRIGSRASSWKGICIHRLPEVSAPDPEMRERDLLAANDALRSALEQCQVDFLYERYSLWSFAAMEHARAQGIPAILEVNAPLIEEQSSYRSLLNRAAAEGVAHRAFAATTAIVAVSEELTDYITKYSGARDKIHIIPNGINPDRFTHTPPLWPGAADNFTVGFVGSLRPWHGLTTLIEAFAEFRRINPGARLLIVGDGPERATVAADLEKRALTGVSFLTGAVEPGAVPGWIASMDVAVAPYPKLANFYFSPLKVYEYMAAGKAVIASRIGQLRKCIEHGVNGWHVEPGDPQSLAEALERLWRNPDLRDRLGHAAGVTVLRDHTWDSVVERIVKLADLAPGELQRVERRPIIRV